MKRNVLLLSALILALNAQAQTLPAPVAQYSLSGGVATDITGNGHDGITMGNLPSVAGHSGVSNTALKFTPNNYVLIAPDTAFDLKQWTLSVLVKLDSFETTDCQVSKIIQRGAQYGGDYIGIEINDNYVDNSCAVFTPGAQQPYGTAAGSSTSYKVPPTGHLNTGTWYCITATYGADTMRTYIDGVLDHKEYWPNAYYNGIGGYPTASPFTIGKGVGSGGSTYYLRGVVDDVTIYNTPLSDAQVAQLCANPTGIDDKAGSIQRSPFPNPAGNLLNFPVSAMYGPTVATIRNIDGRVIATSAMTLSNTDKQATVNTANLAPGLYIIELSNGTQKVTNRFSKL